MPGGALSTLLALASFSLASFSMTSVPAAASVAPSAAVSIAKTPHSPAQEQMDRSTRDANMAPKVRVGPEAWDHDGVYPMVYCTVDEGAV